MPGYSREVMEVLALPVGFLWHQPQCGGGGMLHYGQVEVEMQSFFEVCADTLIKFI